MAALTHRLVAAEAQLSEIVNGHTPWLDAEDAKKLLPLIRDARAAITSQQERFVLAVVNAPSLDENGYICEKSAVLAAVRGDA